MQEQMGFGQILWGIGSFGLVLLLLLACLYALKRWGHWVKRTGAGSLIEVLAQHSFGPKHHLMVVKVREESFLLGISPQGMHYLTRIESGSETGAPSTEPPEKNRQA